MPSYMAVNIEQFIESMENELDTGMGNRGHLEETSNQLEASFGNHRNICD